MSCREVDGFREELSEPAHSAILPDGQINDFAVQPSSQKYFLFTSDPNHFTYPHRPVSPEGRLAIVTDAGRDAVDAGGADNERR
jgi:hypothetical protein